MAYAPDFTTAPDPVHFYILGSHVFYDNIAVGPANVDGLAAASGIHSTHAAQLTEAWNASKSHKDRAGYAAEITVAHWWAQATAKAAIELAEGRLEVGVATIASASIEGV